LSASQPGGQPTGRIALQNAEAKAQQLIQEKSSSGSALLNSVTKDQCTRLATAIATFGGTATLTAVSKKKTAAADAGPTKNAFKQEGATLFWTYGHVSDALASEAIALLRFFVQTKSAAWVDATMQVLKKYANLVFDTHDRILNPEPYTWKKLEDQTISRCFAALVVLFGFKESLRVGGKVSVRS
jgi:hypothetical protein